MKPRIKPTCKPLATALVATLQLALHAAVPLAWEARPGNPAPASFDRYHGEALEFRCTFRGFGELPFSSGADIRLWYQTNGMGQAWWSVPATVSSNVLSATWSPALDPGADRVSLFFGAPSNAYAAAVLRLRHSPGFAPGAMPDPESFRESDPVFAAWLSAFQESDPVFSSWLATFEVPETSLEPSTNYTDRVLGAFAATGAVVRAATYGTPTRWTDATGCVWEVTLDGAPWVDGDNALVYTDDGYGVCWMWGEIDVLEYSHGTWSYSCGHRTASFVATGPEDATVLVMHDVSSDPPLADITLVRIPLTNLVGRVALTNDLVTTESDPTVPDWAKEPDKPTYTPEEIGAAPAAVTNEMAEMRTENQLVYRLYQGSNVVAEVTNYNSNVHAPELRIMQLNESNEYVTVWAETNGLARTLAGARQYTDDATGAVARAVAPRAWSKTTSGLGADAPPDTTWVSTPRTVIAGGLEYAKVVDTFGEVWVLSSNGMAANFNPDTNAYFRITADDGTDIFSIEKTDAQVVGADADVITVGESTVVIPVGVVSVEHPTMFWRQALDSGSWADESTPPTGATVTWTGGTGAWVCTVTWSGTRPSSMFFRFTFLQEGGVVIRNHATSDISAGIYVNGVKFVPSVSGNNLIWTKQ